MATQTQTQQGAAIFGDYGEGGLWEGGEATIVRARAVVHDFKRKDAVEPINRPALAITIEGETIPTEDHRITENWSAGDLSRFSPSGDGKRFIPADPTFKIHQKSNVAKNVGALIKLVEAAGFSSGPYRTDDVTVLEGIRAVWARQVTSKDDEGKERSTLLPTKVLAVGKKPAKAPTASAPTTTQSTAATTASPEVDTQVQELLLAVLTENGGKIERSKVTQKVFPKVLTSPNRQAIIQRVYDESFYEANGFTYDGTTISLG